MKTRLLLLFGVTALLLHAGCGLFKKEDTFNLEKILESRPYEKKYVFDYAHLLKHSLENKEEHMGFFKKRYGVEMLIVTIPFLENKIITHVASEMFTKWNIGRNSSGKGILLLLSSKEKLIKVEVGYGAEGVFTDLFCGYIERKQLKRYFENNQIDEGLSATIEEFIGRAEGNLTDDEIRKKIDLEEKYLSGGGGIKKKVTIGEIEHREELSEEERVRFSGQLTPEATFTLLLETFKKNINDPNLDIYTEESKILKKYQASTSKALSKNIYRLYSASYEIKQKGDRAVVLYFQNRRVGPLFLKKTSKGWQFDIISTAKWIRYTFNNEWHVGGTNHPYMFAFQNNQYSQYVWDYDYYDDYWRFSEIESNYNYYINQFQEKLQQNPDDYGTLISLAEIFCELLITKKSIPLLKKAIEINPKDPRPFRYLGLINRDSLESANVALEYFKKSIELAPNDPRSYHYAGITCWRLAEYGNILSYYDKAAEYMKKYVGVSENKSYGCNKVAYFYYRKEDYSQARKWFKKSLEHDPANAYAQGMLKKIEAKETKR